MPRSFLVLGGLILLLIGVFSAISPAPVATASAFDPQPLVKVPAKPDPDCRTGRAQIYDECSDQREIMARAMEKGRALNRPVLVVAGAEWCIWCHVMDHYFQGAYDRFEYQVEENRYRLQEKGQAEIVAQARELNRFVAENFVIAKIETKYAPNGDNVLREAGVAEYSWVPYVFVVDSRGNIIETMEKEVEGRSIYNRRDNGDDWFRGYDRPVLQAALTRLRDLALQANARPE